mgnify:CR=1 FL=1
MMRALGVLAIIATARAPMQLTSNFGDGQEIPPDHRGDEDNISPPMSWTGVPKNTESFVLLVDSAVGTKGGGTKQKTHWIVYDIPKEVAELREELSGAGSSDVGRLGMKDDAGQAPVVRCHALSDCDAACSHLTWHVPHAGGRSHG